MTRDIRAGRRSARRTLHHGDTTMPRSLLLGAALLAASIPFRPASAQDAGPAGEGGPRLFTVDDAVGLVRVDDPRISPDGSRILYTRSVLDWEENERTRRIWAVEADGANPRPFTGEEGDADPRWSPDGRWVAFTREVEREEGDDEVRQIFLLPTGGGEARRLTSHPTSVGDVAWGPEGRRLFFVAEDSLPDDEEERREKGYDAVFVNEGPNGQTRGGWSNLWWVPAVPDSGEARPLTEGERIVGAFDVSPDGRRVAFTYRTEDHRNEGHRAEIAVVDVESGDVRDLTDNAAPESDPAWSPDGSRLAFVAPDRETWRLDQGNLYLMDPADGATRQLAEDFPGEIGDVRWSPDGDALVLTARRGTDVDLHRLDVGTGRVERTTSLGGTVGGFSLDAAGERIAFEFESPARPGDLYASLLADPGLPAGEAEGAGAVRLTAANPEVEAKALATPEIVRWTSFDGTEIEGLLYRPPSTASGTRAGSWRAPGALVLEIHGGPAGVFGRSFDADAQVLAAHGYAVLQPNVRGSSGYGDAFLRGNMEDIGGGDFRDLMAGVDSAVTRGVAHADSLAVKGWSYGGILGGWTLTRTDRFRAASLGAMVTDWVSEFGEGFHFDVVRWYLGGDPWSDTAFWRERSSFTHVDRVSTPTILFHGAEDRVDTPGQSMNFHQALRHFGVPNRYVLFPREGHGIREPRHHRTRLVEELRWFQRWVRGDEGWTPPERPEPEGEDGDEEGGAG